MKTLKHAALAALTAGEMCTAAASTGYAASSIDARLEALENELRALRAEVAERDAKIAAMEEKTAKIDAIAAKTDDMPKFKPNKLEMESADGQFSMGIAGRIQADAYAIDDDNSALNPTGNGAQLRRARLGAYGKMFGAWQYKFEVEYAGDKVAIKDAYVQTGLTDELKIRAGHFKEFYGIDHLTSDNYVTFMERASSSVYWPDEAMGVGLIYGDEKLYGIQAGIYSPGVASGGAGGTTDWSVTGRGYVARRSAPASFMSASMAAIAAMRRARRRSSNSARKRISRRRCCAPAILRTRRAKRASARKSPPCSARSRHRPSMTGRRSTAMAACRLSRPRAAMWRQAGS